MDLPGFLSSYLGLRDGEMQRAAITGIFQTAGVVITGLVAVLTFWLAHRAARRRDREMHDATIGREKRLREEKVQDIQTALLADIKSYPHRVSASALDQHLAEIAERIRGAPATEPFTPFVPREVAPQLWTLAAKEVHLLPAEVIDPVVSFYSQVETINLFADDLRSERFATLSNARKIAMYEDYIELKRYAAQLAADAQLALLRTLGLPISSNPEPGQSGRKRASEEEASATPATVDRTEP